MKKLFAVLCISILSMSFAFHYHTLAVRANNSSGISATAFVEQMKTGWNLGNSLDSHYGDPKSGGNLSQETIWGNPKITQEQINLVKAQGFDVIRVPVSWYTHTYRDENDTIHISSEWLARVCEVVDYCINDDFYVIINTHHDGEVLHAGVSDKDFDQVKADATSLWSEISAYFSSYDEHLIFESYNEIDNLDKSWSFGKKAASQMNELNQIFVNTVRASGGNNDERLLMVPTLLDNPGEKFQKAFVLPSDTVPGKIIVTVHNYSQTFDQTMDNTFSNMANFSKNLGVPIIIGEWGTTSKFSPAQYRLVHASNYIARANKFGLKCIYWDNGSNYAIIDRKNLTVNSEMISAIMNPSEYTSDASAQLSDFDGYLYMTIDQKTGALKEDKHWGTLLVNADGNGGYAIPAGKTSIYVGLVARDNMSDQRIHYLYFFDSHNNITGKINENYGFTEKVAEIPEGTVYARIGINNSYSKTSKKEYKEAVENGTLSILINLY
ncbi:glycoside hydrolase family 5 protein [Butyrivibrio sp. VCD2006]|uniref:glycoside hydrolase family 5 protein n=1 Tax=Butyrivibrio sp. VCD2006 TaxID=1280664 RepID=UPI00042A54C3|nr:glycoside hydrolase family 5 protein [Butyrivibrio sp. VCD2006]